MSLEKMEHMEISLQKPMELFVNYVTAVMDGELLYTSDMGLIENEKPKCQGKVGVEFSLEKSYKASRIMIVNKTKAQ